MKSRFLAFGLATLGFSTVSNADVVGMSAGVIGWYPSYSGSVQSGDQAIDVENNLGLDREWHPQAYVAVEHFVPLLPNLKLQFTELNQKGDGQVSLTLFNDVVLSGDVHTELDLSHTDLILYYEVLDNVVSLDVGLDVKFFDGELTIENRGIGGARSETDLSEVIPLLYVAPSVDLPFTGLSAGAELAGIAYSGNRLTDFTARIRYEVAVLGIEAGWRQLNLKLDDIDDIDADVKIAGPYVSVGLDF